MDKEFLDIAKDICTPEQLAALERDDEEEHLINLIDARINRAIGSLVLCAIFVWVCWLLGPFSR